MGSSAIIIKQVKKLIKKGIERFAKEHDAEISKTWLYIYSKDSDGNAGLKLWIREKGIFMDKEFKDLCNAFDRNVYLAMGFDVQEDTALWISKFIKKSASDMNTPPRELSYLIVVHNNELRMKMYKDGNEIKEVSVDYILETK